MLRNCVKNNELQEILSWKFGQNNFTAQEQIQTESWQSLIFCAKKQGTGWMDGWVGGWMDGWMGGC